MAYMQAQFVMPQGFSSPGWSYQQPYNRQAQFIAPYGLDGNLQQEFFLASNAFRQHDGVYPGFLDYHEFKRALESLGQYMDGYQHEQLWMMLTGGQQWLSEPVFVEYWVTQGVHPFNPNYYNHFQMYPTRHHHHHGHGWATGFQMYY